MSLDQADCVGIPIIGGAPEAQLFRLNAAQMRSIVAVELSPSDVGASAGLCTGVVLAPGVVLSAAHCFDRDGDRMPDQADATIVVAGSASGAKASSITMAWLHPELDVALLLVDGLDSLNEPLEALPPRREPVDQRWPGTPVELAGFGINEHGMLGSVAFVIEEIARVEDEHVVVDGMGRTGACTGDSGGPLFGRGDDGLVEVLGVLDDGSTSCTGEDRYTRVDRIANWEPFREQVLSEPAAGIVGCAGLSAEGSCMRGLAFYCDDGVRTVDDCTATGRVCGWDGSAVGFRCVGEGEDACGGIGSFARCEGDALVTCSKGAPRTSWCDACDGTCIPWVDGLGAGCG